MKNFRIIIPILSAIGFILLNACSQRGVTPPPVSNQTGSAIEPKSPASALASPLQSPLRNTTARGVPTPAPSRAAVAGRIIATSATGRPTEGLNIFFGTKLPLTPGPDFLINFSPENSPKSKLDQDGYFAISNLPPGEYSLVIWTPHNSFMIGEKQYPEKILFFRVIAGQQLDLGEMEAKLP
jgi:hypothetical protein